MGVDSSRIDPERGMKMDILSIAAALGSGLNAGVFFAFSVFVLPALNRLPPDRAVTAMQSINEVALRPSFMVVFFGTALAGVGLIVRSAMDWQRAGSPYFLVAGLLLVIGVFAVTAAGNVPLNNALATASSVTADAPDSWHRFASGWSLWNGVRTVAASAACLLAILGLIASSSRPI